ncbi:prolyl oligopeptidase family serine peptidase [Crocinitomicaceae bacterium]|nr:prolyl oligopeptidase family serine peptidase [Crocinitomicaceae bacterium]
MKKYLTLLLIIPFISFGQLKLSEIMQGDDFVGHLPKDIKWDVSGRKVCYDQKVDGEFVTFCYDYKSKSIDSLVEDLIVFDRDQSLFNRQFQIIDNELSYWDKTKNTKHVLFSSEQRLSNLQRGVGKNHIYFQMGKNLFEWCLEENTQLKQITNFTNKIIPKTQNKQGHLFEQQKELFEYFSKNDSKKTDSKKGLKSIYTGDGDVVSLKVHPKGQFVLLKKHLSVDQKQTSFMSFVNADGYTETKTARPKVSQNEPSQYFGVFSRSNDTLIWVDFSGLSDLDKKPSYISVSDSVNESVERNLFMNNALFLSSENAAILDVRSADNKDRWIVLLDLESGEATELIHEHDEAWIGGPGISSWNMVPSYLSWMKDDESFLFQSERSGFSHLYSYDIPSGAIDTLTSGRFEIRSVTKSIKENKLFIACNRSHPGDRNLFILNLNTKDLMPVLENEGAYEVSISPSESVMAYRYSSSNRPWELYVSKLKPGAEPFQITSSTTKEFDKYNWMKPEFIDFEADDGTTVYARVYEPNTDRKNGAAVFFVHGAGYLQNAHHFWSGYFREYMFHHLLVEKGYTVLDLDYRASDGYGRDYRTAIYRHMGGRDLEDYIDAKKFMVENYELDSTRIGIYGGSYGGFITLMALLTKPNEFACGAALRSVTDWSHYNHEYTSNILNYPETDSLAYRRSSPIYFAENLTKPLLMLHGMEDNNVQFQDVVRLSQRFIELGKEDWELAVFPIEAHGFKEASSWTDEYRRILELFEKHLK